MAIYLIPGFKKLKDRNHNISELKKTLKADYYDDYIEADLKKALQNQTNYFIWYGPFAEYEDEVIKNIHGGFNREDEMDSYFLTHEEI